MRVLILYNIADRLTKGIPSDLACEQEIRVIVPLVAEVLEARGHSVESLKADYDLWDNLRRRRNSIDLVFNLAEGFGGENENETAIPAILEALRLPFTGASSHNMHFTLDKEYTKLVLRSYGIPVAQHQLFRTSSDSLNDALSYPLIVKPVREEASIGIHNDSVVSSEEMLRRKVAEVLTRYRQPALVEEFIDGREISIGLVGNPPDLQVLPAVEFLFNDKLLAQDKIRSYEYKWGGYKENMVPALLDDSTKQSLFEYSRIAFVASECRDYARVDYRVNSEGGIYLLEVNFNPGIGPNTHELNNTLTLMASLAGLSFGDLIERVVCLSAARYRDLH